MESHEKLKEICDKIGYIIINSIYYATKDGLRYSMNGYYRELNDGSNQLIDVREIIFTQDFMNKYTKFIYENVDKKLHIFCSVLECNLNNPVDYLYSLITKK